MRPDGTSSESPPARDCLSAAGVEGGVEARDRAASTPILSSPRPHSAALAAPLRAAAPAAGAPSPAAPTEPPPPSTSPAGEGTSLERGSSGATRNVEALLAFELAERR